MLVRFLLLNTNSDGSLVSGVQTVLVRVSVPKGTLGAQVDADGNYYYELPVSVNVAQRVTSWLLGRPCRLLTRWLIMTQRC